MKDIHFYSIEKMLKYPDAHILETKRLFLNNIALISVEKTPSEVLWFGDSK